MAYSSYQANAVRNQTVQRSKIVTYHGAQKGNSWRGYMVTDNILILDTKVLTVAKAGFCKQLTNGRMPIHRLPLCRGLA